MNNENTCNNELIKYYTNKSNKHRLENIIEDIDKNTILIKLLNDMKITS